MDLLWKPTAGLIRFVLAITSRGPIILMCSDLHQDPVMALELYCARVRIETMFYMLKNVMAVFRYRLLRKTVRQKAGDIIRPEYVEQPGVLTVTGLLPSPVIEDTPAEEKTEQHSIDQVEKERQSIVDTLIRRVRYLLTLKGRPPFRMAGIEKFRR